MPQFFPFDGLPMMRTFSTGAMPFKQAWDVTLSLGNWVLYDIRRHRQASVNGQLLGYPLLTFPVILFVKAHNVHLKGPFRLETDEEKHLCM